MTDPHATLRHAFSSITEKESLAWSIVDTKSEAAVVRAISASVNRIHGVRRALVEYPPRVDLVILRDRFIGSKQLSSPELAYEAKAAYLTDFQPRRISRTTPDWYLGPCVDIDLTKLQGLAKLYPGVRTAALFFLYELSNPRRQLKYGHNPPVSLQLAAEALEQRVTLGKLAAPPVALPCGTVDETDVTIHMYIFDPR